MQIVLFSHEVWIIKKYIKTRLSNSRRNALASLVKVFKKKIAHAKFIHLSKSNMFQSECCSSTKIYGIYVCLLMAFHLKITWTQSHSYSCITTNPSLHCQGKQISQHCITSYRLKVFNLPGVDESSRTHHPPSSEHHRFETISDIEPTKTTTTTTQHDQPKPQ